MLGIGIDIGSTATKVAVVDERGAVVDSWMNPTGFSSVEAANAAREHLEEVGLLAQDHSVVATGYGRNAVSYADKVVTEITCHGKRCCQSIRPRWSGDRRWRPRHKGYLAIRWRGEEVLDER